MGPCSEVFPGALVLKNIMILSKHYFLFHTFLYTYPLLVNYLFIFPKNGPLSTFATWALNPPLLIIY